MRSSADEAVTPPDGERPRLSGQRAVIALFVVVIAVAIVVIFVGLIVIAGRGEGDACDTEPEVCQVVRDYAAAFNARDAATVVELLTERGLRGLLDVSTREELEQSFARLTEADRIRDVEISRVNVEGDRATVVARFLREDEGSNAVLSLVRRDGRWRIDR